MTYCICFGVGCSGEKIIKEIGLKCLILSAKTVSASLGLSLVVNTSRLLSALYGCKY